MAGGDFNVMNRWRWEQFTFSRKRPLYLPDREGFEALLGRLAETTNGESPQVMINGERTTSTDPMEVLTTLPRHAWACDIWVGGMSVRLSSEGAGQTSISVNAVPGELHENTLYRLVSVLEQHGRPLGWTRHLHRLPVFSRSGRNVIARRARNEVEDREESKRVARISAVSGFLAGLLGAAATLIAAAIAGRT